MFKKGTKLYSLHKAFQMHEKCSNCGLKYTIEPSFFYGAMYINYALTVGLSIVTFTIATLFFNLNLIQIFIPIVVVLVLTVPITIRLSRIIWINIFIKYQKNIPETIQNE